MCLWTVLEAALQTHRTRPALTKPDGSVLHYAELLDAVDNKARMLGSVISAGSRVAVFDEHPYQEALHTLALIKLGAVIVPMALKYGEQRCVQIIRHTRPDIVYTSKASLISDAIIEACLSAETTIIADQTVCLSPKRREEKAGWSKNGPLLEPSFIMYTSGSTGKPKGAILTYANILANIRDIQTYFDVTPDDHLLINRSLSHASVMTGEFLYGLISGARLTLYPEAFVPRRLLSFMESNKITIFCTTPTIFYQLSLDKAGIALPHLRQVALMGEYLHKQVANLISERYPAVQFYMLYGQTEAGPRITYLPSNYFTVKEGCIGRPLPSIDIRVIDENGKDVERGQSGELLARGPNMFIGYWDQPELTAVKMRDGWLHTGDIVYQGEDGFLYISGRKDDMIIRAGMNIYPIEIEEVLLSDPRIREAVVSGVADPKYGQKLHITIAPEGEGAIAEAEVLELCRKHLASYQYPDAIHIVSEIPRNNAGKIMRRLIV